MYLFPGLGDKRKKLTQNWHLNSIQDYGWAATFGFLIWLLIPLEWPYLPLDPWRPSVPLTY